MVADGGNDVTLAEIPELQPVVRSGTGRHVEVDAGQELGYLETTGLKPPPDLPVSMSAADAVREYYEALRRGEPLYPYFVEADDVVKFGVSETLVGYDAVAEGLREQSRATGDWTVESGDLRVLEFGDAGSFADSVRIAWTDVESGERVTHDTRWSGTLVRRDEEWLFAGMHVSVAEA